MHAVGFVRILKRNMLMPKQMSKRKQLDCIATFHLFPLTQKACMYTEMIIAKAQRAFGTFRISALGAEYKHSRSKDCRRVAKGAENPLTYCVLLAEPLLTTFV